MHLKPACGTSAERFLHLLEASFRRCTFEHRKSATETTWSGKTDVMRSTTYVDFLLGYYSIDAHIPRTWRQLIDALKLICDAD